MAKFSLFADHQWHPFAWLGIDHRLLTVQADTVLYSWVVLGIIIFVSGVGRFALLHYPDSMTAYLAKRYVRAFSNMIAETTGRCDYQYMQFFITMFTFLLFCNCLVLIPTFEEPTKDLNTTLALSVLLFLYVQWEAIKKYGVLMYLNEYFKTPIPVRGVVTPYSIITVFSVVLRLLLNGIIGCILLPIELIGKISSIISLSFRLFGNILAGSVISLLWQQARSGSLLWQLLGIIVPINLLIMVIFGLLEGVIQAGVFVMLGISYLGRVLQPHGE